MAKTIGLVEKSLPKKEEKETFTEIKQVKEEKKK